MSLDNMTIDEVKFWSKGCRDILLEIEKNGLFRCPECKHFMVDEAKDYNICPVCGVEFGYDSEHRETTEVIWRP